MNVWVIYRILLVLLYGINTLKFSESKPEYHPSILLNTLLLHHFFPSLTSFVWCWAGFNHLKWLHIIVKWQLIMLLEAVHKADYILFFNIWWWNKYTEKRYFQYFVFHVFWGDTSYMHDSTWFSYLFFHFKTIISPF